MKTLTFRPLRLVKKTGKIVVASYMQWYKVRCADYNKFNLVIDDEYKQMPKKEYAHDHQGNLLYFFTYNPSDIPIYQSVPLDGFNNIPKEHERFHGTKHSDSNRIYYIVPGTDSLGTPTFSHWTAEKVAREDVWNYYGPSSFEPLTVETVVKWFGWWLYQLENSYLKIGKS